MESKQVVITGLGVISPVGLDVATAWQNLVSGKSGISHVSEMPPDLKGMLGIPDDQSPDLHPEVKIFGFVKDLDPEKYMDRKTARRMDRFSHFAVAAAAEAIQDAKLGGLLQEIKSNPELAYRIGVKLGTGSGGQITNEEAARTQMQKGARAVSPFAIPMLMPNAGNANIARLYGFKGPNLSANSACASGLDGIILAAQDIILGNADLMLAGGLEAALTPPTIASFARAGALVKKYNHAPQAGSRPFDSDRGGFVASEGGVVLVLEELEHALRRNASIYAAIAGYCQNNDAFDETQPHPPSQAWAIKTALQRAGIMPEQVGYINAHGTSTVLNDKSETAALKMALGKHAYDVKISSTKSMTGHMMGAAGAIETAVCALVIRHGIIPPTINLDNPDPECDLNYVPHKAVKQPVEVALNMSFGFGSHNAVLVLTRYQR